MKIKKRSRKVGFILIAQETVPGIMANLQSAISKLAEIGLFVCVCAIFFFSGFQNFDGSVC